MFEYFMEVQVPEGRVTKNLKKNLSLYDDFQSFLDF